MDKDLSGIRLVDEAMQARTPSQAPSPKRWPACAGVASGERPRTAPHRTAPHRTAPPRPPPHTHPHTHMHMHMHMRMHMHMHMRMHMRMQMLYERHGKQPLERLTRQSSRRPPRPR